MTYEERQSAQAALRWRPRMPHDGFLLEREDAETGDPYTVLVTFNFYGATPVRGIVGAFTDPEVEFERDDLTDDEIRYLTAEVCHLMAERYWEARS